MANRMGSSAKEFTIGAHRIKNLSYVESYNKMSATMNLKTLNLEMFMHKTLKFTFQYSHLTYIWFSLLCKF